MPQKSGEILIIDIFGLGDLIYLGSFVKTIRENTDNRISVIINSRNGSFPFLNESGTKIYLFETWKSKSTGKRLFEFFKSVLKFRKKYGLDFKNCIGLDPRGDPLHWFFLYSLGVKKILSSTIQNPLFLLKKRHTYEKINNCNVFEARQRFLQKIAPSIGLPGNASLIWPWLNIPRDKHPTNELASKNIIFAPEAGFPSKYWEGKKWVILAQKLHEEGWHITLIAHKNDAIDKTDQHLFDRVWTGSLENLRFLLSESRAVIAIDSFVGHLAAACGVPVVSIFGPTSPQNWRPWGKHNQVVILDNYPCRPCTLVNCVMPDRNCLDALSVEDVLGVFRRIIAAGG